MNSRVQGAGFVVLEGDTGAFPDLFLPEQPRASVSIPRPGSAKAKLTPGAVVYPFQRQSGLGLGPELTKPLTGSLSKFQVLPKVGKSQALCPLISLEACIGRAALGLRALSDGWEAVSLTPSVCGMQ